MKLLVVLALVAVMAASAVATAASPPQADRDFLHRVFASRGQANETWSKLPWHFYGSTDQDRYSWLVSKMRGGEPDAYDLYILVVRRGMNGEDVDADIQWIQLQCPPSGKIPNTVDLMQLLVSYQGVNEEVRVDPGTVLGDIVTDACYRVLAKRVLKLTHEN